MRKLPHRLLYATYSDYELDTELSPYEKKYNISCVIDFGEYQVLRHVAYSNKKDTFSALRKLAKLKHEAVENGRVGLKILSKSLPGVFY